MKHDFAELYAAFVAEGFRKRGPSLLHEFPHGIVVVRPSGFRDIFNIFFGIWLDHFEPRPATLSPYGASINGSVSDLCGAPLRFDTPENPDRTLEAEERFEKNYRFSLAQIPEIAVCLKHYANEEVLARAYADKSLPWHLFPVRVRDYLAKKAAQSSC
jgi:hypothetical protein